MLINEDIIKFALMNLAAQIEIENQLVQQTQFQPPQMPPFAPM